MQAGHPPKNEIGLMRQIQHAESLVLDQQRVPTSYRMVGRSKKNVGGVKKVSFSLWKGEWEIETPQHFVEEEAQQSG